MPLVVVGTVPELHIGLDTVRKDLADKVPATRNLAVAATRILHILVGPHPGALGRSGQDLVVACRTAEVLRRALCGPLCGVLW